MDERREFNTAWGVKPTFWAERSQQDLIGCSVDGEKSHLWGPQFRPFDFIEKPNVPVTFLSASSNRALVEAVVGTQDYFFRNADFDDLHFHMAGETTYETEVGVFTAKAGDVVLIPFGISYRSTGVKGALRMTMQVNEPLEAKLTAADQIGHTEFDVEWVGGADFAEPAADALFPKGEVIESVRTWDDRPGERTLLRRDYALLVNSVKTDQQVHHFRLFDIFKEMTGVRGPGPMSFLNEHFFLECYNTAGEQWAFHRGNRTEEAQLQFMGLAGGLSEFGTGDMTEGELYFQKRGISHRVLGNEQYRRMVFYSKERWDVTVDLAKPVRQSTFKVSERILESAPWRDEQQAALKAAAE